MAPDPHRPTLFQALALYGLLVLVGITTVIPLFWMVSTSLKLPGVPAASFLPGAPTLANYAKVLQTTPFGRYYVNTVIVSLAITIGQVATSALAAYAFARLRFSGRDSIFL